MERRSSKEILHVTKLIIGTVAAQVRENESRPGVRELAQLFIHSSDRRMPARLLRYPQLLPGHPEHDDFVATARDSAIFRLWGQTKVVYAMDDLLLGYLSQSASSAIPTQIFQNLPHANPFVLLPRPDMADERTAYYRTHIGVPWGAFVFGRYNQAQQLCSTRDDKREDLGLMFAGFLETAAGPVLQVVRCTVPLGERMVTVEDVVSRTIARFNFNEDLAEDDQSKLEAWLRRYVAQVFNSLLYICTDQPDVQVQRPGRGRAGATKKRRKQRPRADDIETFVQLGFRMGPALHRRQQQSVEERRGGSAEADGSGRRYRPHQKVGHYRTYWTGPGRKIARLRWIAPFWVNEDLLDGDDGPRDVVVRPVRKRP